MPEAEASGHKPVADTVLGKILIGVAVAAGSAFISWFVSRATYVPPPPPKPSAAIVPKELLAQANAMTEFSAEGSTVPSAERPAYVWRVGGLEPNKSPVARCSVNEATLSCRFMLPGTFAVSVEVVDANGQSNSAVSVISVSVPGGYLGLFIDRDDPDALRSLLYDVDWIALQSLVTRPIVLQDPETNAPIFAALVEPPFDAPDPPPWRGKANGLKIALPPLPSEARSEFEIALAQIGVVTVTLPAYEVFLATERGMVDLGFVAIDSPEALSEIRGAQ
jgi:hypothetical protein